MRVLVTGAEGQLGFDVVSALRQRGHDVIGVDYAQMDITDRTAVFSVFSAQRPQAVIHCAAYTCVDRAESEPDVCARVNMDGTQYIAQASESVGAKMIYISTDYVYSGDGCDPFPESAPIAPCNVYGKTKYAGEIAAQACSRLFVVRTSWVFGLHGSNFVRTMLRLSQDRDTLRVVCDQVGSPTFTEDLAELLCAMIETEKYGTYNASNAGFCCWHTFAQQIFTMFGRKVCVIPIPSRDYDSPAVRPKNSRMSKQALIDAGFTPLPDWKDALARYVHRFGEILAQTKQM